MTTTNDSPAVPPGGTQPVPVHITGTDISLAKPRKPRKQRTKFETYVLTANDPTMLILPDSADRVIAFILPVDNDIILGPSKGVVGAAVNTVANVPNPNGAYCSKGISFRVDGSNPVYAGVTTVASNSRVAVIETYWSPE